MNFVALPGLSHQWLYGEKKFGILAFHGSWKYFGESSVSDLYALSCYPAFSQTSPSYSFHLTSNKYFKYLQETFLLFLVKLALVVPPVALLKPGDCFTPITLCYAQRQNTLCVSKKTIREKSLNQVTFLSVCSQKFLSN